MMSSPMKRLILGLLFLLSIGTSGIAITYFPYLKSNSYTITVDCDSFRTESAEKLVESLHNTYFFNISNKDIQAKIIDFQPVEHVTIKRYLFKPLHIDIQATKPVLMVSNQKQFISLSISGIPFRYWPEHGQLPCYGVPSHIDFDALLYPDSLLQEFYRLILEIQTESFHQLTRFSHFLSGDENSLILYDSDTSDQLKLPREFFRNRAEHLHNIDAWLSSGIAGDVPMVYDARFSGIIVQRSLQKDGYHG